MVTLPSGLSLITHDIAPLASGHGQPLKAALFYTKGQALGGVRSDEAVILEALQRTGLKAEMLDLANLSQAADGAFLLRNPETGLVTPWTNPHAALMYHGAIAPANAAQMLDALDTAGTTVVNGRRPWEILTDKALFAQYMQPRGVNVIPTTVVSTPEEMRAVFAANGGRSVFKKPISTEGDDIFVVKSQAQLDEAIEHLPAMGGRLIGQPMIDSTIDSTLEPGIRGAIESRIRPDLWEKMQSGAPLKHEFRIQTGRHNDGSIDIAAIYVRVGDGDVNNVAQGAQAIRVNFSDLDPRDQKTIIDAVRALPENGQVVGWDLIGKPGQRRIIEGNSGSGLPEESEGFDPLEVVASHAQIVREAAERSPLLR